MFSIFYDTKCLEFQVLVVASQKCSFLWRIASMCCLMSLMKAADEGTETEGASFYPEGCQIHVAHSYQVLNKVTSCIKWIFVCVIQRCVYNHMLLLLVFLQVQSVALQKSCCPDSLMSLLYCCYLEWHILLWENSQLCITVFFAGSKCSLWLMSQRLRVFGEIGEIFQNFWKGHGNRLSY